MENQTNPTPSLPPSNHLPSSTNWRLFLELSAFSFFIFPFGNIFGPLIIWMVKKDTNALVNEEGKKVINFNLSWTLWSLLTCGFGFFAWIVIAIISTLKAANNEPFKHPLTIKILK